MKKDRFVLALASLVILSFGFILGCGNATGGGGGGGGGGALFAADIWVSTTGSDDAPGAGTWDNPLRTISRATLEVGSNEVIGVRNGIYNEHIIWTTREGVTLRGESTTLTTIDGTSNGRCIKIYDVVDAQVMTIESLTIKNGKLAAGGSQHGAGIYYYTGSGKSSMLKVDQVIISDNSVSTDAECGGGIYTQDIADTLIIENSSISGNSARSGGGMFFVSNAYVKNCEIKDNHALYGGGVYSSNVNSCQTIEACTISGNTAESEAGGVFIGTKGKLINCAIFNNKCTGSGTYGGGVLHYNNPSGGVLEIINCTIVSNEASDGGGVLADYAGAGSNIVKNCIIWGNEATVATTHHNYYSSTPDITYSDIGEVHAGTGNQNLQPYFEETTPPYTLATDFKLTSSTSTDVTQGGTTGTGIPTVDIIGTSRSGHNSMGAWQY